MLNVNDVSFTDPDVYEECGGDVPSSVRTIRYPLYGNIPYQTCVWTINRTNDFQVRFKSLQLTAGVQIILAEGLGIPDPVFRYRKRHFYGTDLHPPIKSQDGFFKMELSPYYNPVEGKGFEMEIEAVEGEFVF